MITKLQIFDRLSAIKSPSCEGTKRSQDELVQAIFPESSATSSFQTGLFPPRKRKNKIKRNWKLWPCKCLQDGSQWRMALPCHGRQMGFYQLGGQFSTLFFFPLWLTVIHNVAFCPLGRIFQLTDSIAISFPSAWEGPGKGLQLDSIFLTIQ